MKFDPLNFPIGTISSAESDLAEPQTLLPAGSDEIVKEKIITCYNDMPPIFKDGDSLEDLADFYDGLSQMSI